MMQPPNQHAAGLVAKRISDPLQLGGLYIRVFSRAKSPSSMSRKIESKQYRTKNKKMQDMLGVRITCYFADDIDIVCKTAARIFACEEHAVDPPDESTFNPARNNMVLRFKPDDIPVEKPKQFSDLIDDTFELQIRTVLAEGWYEVDHDLRYKDRDAWSEDRDLSRALNGIGATLETCDWSTLRLFDQLAHRHYKRGNWERMLAARMRIRFVDGPQNPELAKILGEDTSITKALLRADREAFLLRLIESGCDLPRTPANVALLMNRVHRISDRLLSAEPDGFEAMVPPSLRWA